MRLLALSLCVLAGCTCNEKPAPPLSSLKPAPLPLVGLVGSSSDGGVDDREAAYQVAPTTPFGEPKASEAQVTLRLSADGVELQGKKYGFEDPALRQALIAFKSPLLVSWAEDVYVAQAAPVFAALEDGEVPFQLSADRLGTFYSPVLRDEAEFGAWLEEPKPGKLRVVQRADGLELQTNMGKLPGRDPNGPTIPLRGGKLDVATLRDSLGRIKARFKNEDVCLLPSFGTELDRVAEVMSGTYRADGDSILSVCLVYPRPAARDR